MSLAAARDKYNEIEGNGMSSYVRIFLGALIISGFIASAAIRLIQSNDTRPMQVTPLIRISPLEVAIAEAVTRPFTTDPVTPYREQLREAAVLDPQLAVAVSGNSDKTESGKDSTPEGITKPKPESPVDESYVRKLRTVRRTVHPVSRTVKGHSAENRMLLARVERPIASTVAPKAIQTAPATEDVAKTIHEGGAATETPALTHSESISVPSAVPAQVNFEHSIASKPVENKNSISYSSSSHSPLVSPYTTESEVKAAPADTSQDTAAAYVSKVENAGKEDNKEDKKKGLSAGTILEWTIRIVGFALLFLK